MMCLECVGALGFVGSASGGRESESVSVCVGRVKPFKVRGRVRAVR